MELYVLYGSSCQKAEYVCAKPFLNLPTYSQVEEFLGSQTYPLSGWQIDMYVDNELLEENLEPLP